MSSIAHPEDKKRRGLFGLFTRKAKSSTGDSSLSSGSAGERSVSPARSDESNEGRPISQTHSPTSSSATLTNNNHKADSSVTASSSQRNSLNSESSSSQISRPVSMISLNKNRKRQAPVPPQRVKRTTEGKVADEKQNVAKEKPSLSRHSSDSSGYHEQDIRSYTSPANSDVSSLEISRASLPPTTNLASVSSSSVSSLKGGKRKAPSPPKTAVKNGEGPISIPESPEENESNESLKDDESDCRSSTSSFVDKSLSLVENHEERKSPVDVEASKICQERETNGEDQLDGNESNGKGSRSPESKDQSIKEIEMVEEKITIEEHDEFSSLDTNSLPMSNDSLKDGTHNESKDSERSVEELVAEAPTHPIDTYESPSHSLVTSENEIQTQTVSLSSETSATSLEMINPRDIQRPKRHKRKKIPEEFMKCATLDETSSVGSNDVSSLPSDVSNPHNDASSSLHTHKNFERVYEVDEDEREFEGNRSVDENLESFAQTSPKVVEELSENGHRILERNTVAGIFNSETTKTSKLTVMYVEDVNVGESTTDPVSPPRLRKEVFTSKVQLSTSEDERTILPSDTSVPDHRSVSITQISSDETHGKQDLYRNDVIAELKSAIESSSDSPEDSPYAQPRILNLKPKDKNDWHYSKPSDYNLILNFRKKNDSPCDSSFNRSASISSYESIDNSHFQKSRSSTETSYESVPPPPPDTRPPFPSDGESKTSSSVPSRQSSFNDNDSVEFVKPKVPVFSISTYQSRASKVSYDKKLSRSESLASFKDLQGNEAAKSNELKKLTRSDSQRNQIFTSDSIKKSTSTTILNLGPIELNDKAATIPNVRPSLIKSQSRSSLHENESGLNSTATQNGTIQFDFSSREPITFNRTLPNTYSNLRKAKSSFDVRGNEGRMPDGYEAIPDSGLANEYMRLQDDFMKWQHQLLQNQQLLHNRVAPIASNPPVFNSTGVVNNMVNQSSSGAPVQPQRKPVEINIPIRLVDSDEETPNEVPAREKAKQNIQKVVTQANPPSSGPKWSGPSVSVDPWQERPYVIMTQPVVVEPQISRPFETQPRMQTIFQSTPQDAGLQSNNFQTPQMSFQQRPQPSFQPQDARPQPSFQQQDARPQPSFQQQDVRPQPSFQQQDVRPQPSFQLQDTRPTFQQPPQPSSEFQQMPPPPVPRGIRNNVQPVPSNNYQQSWYQQQQPQPTINYQRPPDSSLQNFSEPDTLVTKTYSSAKPQTSSATPFINDKNDDGISARFSSVVTLNNDKNNENTPQKDKVRSVVQLNNSESPLGNQLSSVPFHSKIINGASKIGDGVEQERNVVFNAPTNTSPAPMSSRLVQQAAQQPSSGGFRISPPKVERYSPSKVDYSPVPQVERQSSPPQIERQFSPPQPERQFSPPQPERQFSPPQPVRQFSPPQPERQFSPPQPVRQFSPPQPERQFSPHIVERHPSSPQHEPSPPFGDIKLRHVETRTSPPKSELPLPPAPPPPPPPSLNAPPPPPPPPMSEADRRTATGKKIFGAAYTPQLDAREELMMAIRQFGGSNNLRKSGLPPPNN